MTKSRPKAVRRRSMLMDALLSHLVLSVLVAIITGATFFINTRVVYRQEIEQHAITIVQFVSAQAQFSLLVHDSKELQHLAEKTLSLKDVLFVEIMSPNCDGIKLAAPEFALSDIPPCRQTDFQDPVFARRAESKSNARSFIDASYGVEQPDGNLLFGMPESGGHAGLGAVRIGMAVDRARAVAAVAIRRAVLICAICIAIVLILVLFQLRSVLAPAHELAKFASGIDEESLDRRARVWGPSEIAALADSFNLMLDRLAATLVSKDLAEESSKAKGQFLANMGHELRTPLNAIIGYSELIAEECEDAGQTTFLADLGKIRNSAKILLALMNDLLDFSKVEAGRMEFTVQAIDIQSALQEVADVVEPMARANHNRVVLEASPQALEIFADPLRFRQSLLNLASNACKFTENGTVTLEARQVRHQDRSWCEISVKDTGIGIPPENLKQLFEAFVQLEPSHSRKYGGTGLGLAISRKFCRLMGGDIVVESTLGQGSKFTISLPFEAVPHTSPILVETI